MTHHLKVHKGYLIEGVKRTRGRAILSWVEVVRNDMGACDLMALDRVQWRNGIILAKPKQLG